MALPLRDQPLPLTCPSCLYEKAVLAWDQKSISTALCPRCQHFWEYPSPK